jgi:ubiquinone/menaquinone biosynthesis C-methylase UbiE
VTPPQPTGPAEYGNLAANLRFIDASGLLRRHSEILEIGSGTGALLNRLRTQGHRIQGVDVNGRLIDEGRAWFPDLPVQQVAGTALPFPDQSFDIVMSFDVLEHIPDTDAHLREVRRVLRPGGSYLLQTPNKWTNVVFETIRWRSFTKWRTDHCSLHSLSQLRKRLAAHGFSTQPFAIPVVNQFFRAKVRGQLGWPGLAALAIVNPDRLPLTLRTNLYVAARLTGLPPSRPS